MRHLKKSKKFDRKKSARRALFRSLAVRFFANEKLATVEEKAKFLKQFTDQMITLGKKNTLHSRRKLISQLLDQNIVEKIMRDIAPRYNNRHGGYSRIIKTGQRRGDGAKTAIIELI